MIRVTLLLVLRHLRGDTSFRRGPREAVPLHEPLELDFGTAVHHDQLIKPPISARLDHQRCINHADSVGVLLFPTPQPFILRGDDERMKNRVQERPLFFIGEDQGSQPRAVEHLIGVQNFLAEGLNHRAQPDAAWRDHLPRHAIGINHMAAFLRCQHSGDKRFTDGD